MTGQHQQLSSSSHLNWCSSIPLCNAGSCSCAAWLAPRGAPCQAGTRILLCPLRCVSSDGLRQHPRLQTCMIATISDSMHRARAFTSALMMMQVDSCTQLKPDMYQGWGSVT